jgi:hypothetical protein
VPIIVQRRDPCFSTSSRTPPRAASLLDGGVSRKCTRPPIRHSRRRSQAGPCRSRAEARRAEFEGHQDFLSCELRRFSSIARSASISSWIISAGDSRRTSAVNESVPEIVYFVGLLADERCGTGGRFSLVQSFACSGDRGISQPRLLPSFVHRRRSSWPSKRRSRHRNAMRL